VRVPQWLTILVAVVVIGFGAYRIWLSTRPAAPEGAKGNDAPSKPSRSLFAGGFYQMGKRTHLFVGIIYLLLGGALVATSFGWNPFGNSFGPGSEETTKDTAPTKGPLPVDTIPHKP
jgi:hypothetical protein